MRNIRFSSAVLLPLILLLSVVHSADADQGRETRRIGITAGDGKNGRRFSQWNERIQEQPVQSVTVRVQKRSGGNDTYLNLRFGSGQTFENGRRVNLTDGAAQSITWNVGGQAPNGQPLVLNAYNGEVDIIEASIQYVVSQRPPTISSPPRDREGGWNRPGGRDRDSIDPGFDRDDNRGSDRDDDRWDGRPGYPPGGSGGNDPDAGRRCREQRIRSPRIDIGEFKPTGGLFSGKYKFRGEIVGMCIEEAGYYERGRLKEKINIPLTDQFQRREFEVKVKTGERGEIRVFTSDAREEFISVDDFVQKNSQY